MVAITHALSIVLEYLNSIFHNYGWSIIVFTILFRLVLSPLDIKSKIGMRAYSKEMAKISPKLNEINKKYANDPAKKNQKTQELYKSENVNPLSGCMRGCIPLLIQYPLLIAFYTVFRNMAHDNAAFIFEKIQHLSAAAAATQYDVLVQQQGWSWLWVKNIWMPDIFSPLFTSVKSVLFPMGGDFYNWSSERITAAKHAYDALSQLILGNNFTSLVNHVIRNGFYILPLIAGGTQYLATLITPQSDPNAANNPTTNMMKYLFPLIFVYFCLVSSAALAIYWITTNVISIAVQYIINKVLDAKEKKQAELEGGNVDYEIH